jgi:hypothetical protein
VREKFLQAAWVAGTEKTPGGVLLLIGGKIESGALCSEWENWLHPLAESGRGTREMKSTEEQTGKTSLRAVAVRAHKQNRGRDSGRRRPKKIKINSGFNKKNSRSGSSTHKQKIK